MTEWTDAERTLVVKLWTAGKSATDISIELGLELRVWRSRCAVIGAVHRMNLRRVSPNAGNGRKRPGRRKRVLTPREPATRKRPLIPVFPLPPDEAPPEKLSKLLDWPEINCKWVYTVDGAHRFGCTCQRVDGLSYCARHAAILYRAPEPKRRNAIGRVLSDERSLVSKVWECIP